MARMAQDHALARRLAEGLQAIDGLQVETPETNIVFVDLVGAARARAAEFLPFLKSRGVLASGLYRLRFVTHLDVDAEGIDHAVAAVRRSAPPEPQQCWLYLLRPCSLASTNGAVGAVHRRRLQRLRAAPARFDRVATPFA